MESVLASPTSCLPREWSMKCELQRAIQFGDCETVRALLVRGLDPDVRLGQQKVPALSLAVKIGNLDLARVLLEHNSSANQADSQGLTVLHYACNFFSTAELVHLLITLGRADVNKPNLYAYTPLHIATENKNLKLVKYLVDCGAEVDRRDHDGLTPLMIAVRHADLAIVDFMLNSGADVNACDNHGNTVLLLSMNNLTLNYTIIKRLLLAGADVNVASHAGVRPLLMAIRRTSEHDDEGRLTVQALIEAGADVRAKEKTMPYVGETPLNVALERGQYSLVEMLVRAGADTLETSIERVSPLVHLIRASHLPLARLVACVMPRLRPHDLTLIHRERLYNTDPMLARFLFRPRDGPHDLFGSLPLQHLCRCCIRASLGRHADTIIDGLPVFHKLRQYLKLELL